MKSKKLKKLIKKNNSRKNKTHHRKNKTVNAGAKSNKNKII